tara:strand:- start:1246 stop:1659 length:414 start_codon:yes stop_codon:yes gene_type:complete
MALTPKQEKFAVLVAEGNTQADAYREAYDPIGSEDKTIHENASRLANDSKVSARIKEIQEKAAKSAEVTLEEIVQGIREAAGIASTKKESNALTTAYMALAKVTGQIVDKKELSNKDGKPFHIIVEKEKHKEMLENL